VELAADPTARTDSNGCRFDAYSLSAHLMQLEDGRLPSAALKTPAAGAEAAASIASTTSPT
jgi:hypothetical protein